MSLGQNEYYVRPVNGSDVAGQGTSHATAYQTLNFAVNDIASTHGQNTGSLADRINICDEGTATVTANVSWTSNQLGRTYEGYTSTAGDGGIAVLNMGTTGGTQKQFSGVNYTNFKNLDLFGGLNPLNVNNGIAQNVTVRDTVNGCIIMGQQGILLNCEAYNVNASSFVSATAGNVLVSGCKFWRGSSPTKFLSGNGLVLGLSSKVVRTIVDIGTSTGSGIAFSSWGGIVDGCSIVSRGNASTSSYAVQISAYSSQVSNCLIQGWSTAGQVAVKTTSITQNIYAVTNNAFFDNDTNFIASEVSSSSGNESLGSSPFVDLANDDFTPADVGNVRNGSYGALNVSKGAVQLSAGGGGGPTVTPHPLSNAFHPLGQ